MITKALEIEKEFALNGTSVLNTIALMKGAKILRVHDVKEAKECINLYNLTMSTVEILDLIVSTILPIIDIILVAVMLYWVYKLIRGTSAIIIFRGFVIIYIIWWITDIANMNILSNILGGFISVGVFALIIVFQQEIRRFLLILGSNRITNNKSVLKN